MKLWHLTAIAALLASQAALGATPLSGQWATSCTPLIKRHSIISKIAFSGKTFSAHHQLYADKNCQHLNLEIESDGEHSEHRKEFDWTLNRVVLRLLRPEVVGHYNKNAICGYTDWKLDEERDIAGRFCDPIQNPAANTRYAERFRLRAGKLTFSHFPETLPNDSSPSKLFNQPPEYQQK